MKTLITGVNGFVGRNLANSLAKKDEDLVGTVKDINCDIYINCDIEIRELDITKYQEVLNILRIVRPRYIYHLASKSSIDYSWKNPIETMNVNLNGTLNLLEAIRNLKLNTRVLIIGSSEEYGNITNEKRVNEGLELNPASPYAISKTAQEYVAKQYCKSYDLDIVFTRSFTHIGVGQSDKSFIQRMAKEIVEIDLGIRKPIININSNNIVIDYSPVNQIVEDYYNIMMNAKKGEIYNVGSGTGYRLKEIIKMIIDNSKSKDKIRIREFKDELFTDKVLVSDISKLNKISSGRKKLTSNDMKCIYEYWFEKISKVL